MTAKDFGDPMEMANTFLQFIALVGVACRHSNSYGAGLSVARLYNEVMPKLPKMLREAIGVLERQAEPAFLAAQGGACREGESAILEALRLTKQGES